jgi:hypothetical protein
MKEGLTSAARNTLENFGVIQLLPHVEMVINFSTKTLNNSRSKRAGTLHSSPPLFFRTSEFPRRTLVGFSVNNHRGCAIVLSARQEIA